MDFSRSMKRAPAMAGRRGMMLILENTMYRCLECYILSMLPLAVVVVDEVIDFVIAVIAVVTVIASRVTTI